MTDEELLELSSGHVECFFEGHDLGEKASTEQLLKLFVASEIGRAHV